MSLVRGLFSAEDKWATHRRQCSLSTQVKAQLAPLTLVHSQQHTHVSSCYRSSRLGLSHWEPYAMHRGGCLELYYCNMVEWSWWDSSLI